MIANDNNPTGASSSLFQPLNSLFNWLSIRVGDSENGISKQKENDMTKCLECNGNVPFGRDKFCSTQCSSDYHNKSRAQRDTERKRKLRETAKCVHCKKPLPYRVRTSMYCDKTCFQAYNAEHIKKQAQKRYKRSRGYE